eukprot:GSChrysophyteH1.ASY1.ANO1.2587.1 assembled CDS
MVWATYLGRSARYLIPAVLLTGSHTETSCVGNRGRGDYKIKVRANSRQDMDSTSGIGKKDFTNFLIVSGTANKDLSKTICDLIGTTSTPTDVHQFSDGELSCNIQESVRGKHVYLIQSFGDPVQDNVMELLLTFHRNRGLPITTPYGSRFMWNSAADIAKMLSVCGVDKVISVDLQRAGQNHEACFFSNELPVETVDSTNLFVDYFAKHIYGNKGDCGDADAKQNKVVVLSPNTEFVKKAKRFQRKLEEAACVGKVGYAAFLDDDLMGNVEGCDVIIVDDIVESGLGISDLCRRLNRAGARKIYIAATHGMYTKNVMQLIDLSSVDLVVTTDSLPLPRSKGLVSEKIKQVSVSALLAKVIETELANISGIPENNSDENDNENDWEDVSGDEVPTPGTPDIGQFK